MNKFCFKGEISNEQIEQKRIGRIKKGRKSQQSWGFEQHMRYKIILIDVDFFNRPISTITD